MQVPSQDEVTPLMHQHGIPLTPTDIRKPYQKKLALYIILLSILFERIAFYSIASDISYTLQSNQTFNWTSQHSSTAMYIFSGTSYIFTLIFAIISDAKLGRAPTIIIGFLLYLSGYALVTTIPLELNFFNCNTSASHDTIGHEKCAGWMLGTLVIIAIGSGAVKSNMAVFGAEQIQESRLTSRYFDKYVIAVNVGALIERLVIPYIQQSQFPLWTVYLIPSSAIIIAALLFVIGWKYYIHIKSNETVIANCIPVVINAFQSRRKYYENERSRQTESRDSTSSNLLNASNSLSSDEPLVIHGRLSSLLDFAKAANNGKFHDRLVDDVKSLWNAIIVFSLLIPYWLIYNQIDATFPLQGNYMQVPEQARYVVSWMSITDPIIVILGTIMFNIFVYKYLDIRNQTKIITNKFVIGMGFAILSMCIAGAIEIFRQRNCNDPSHHLSIFYQIPQTVSIGFSQLFAMVASCEFAYFAAPRSAQSLFMGLYFCAIGISSFFGVGYMAIFSLISSKYDYYYKTNPAKTYFECPLNNQTYWSFYTYFFVLAGLQFIFVLIFGLCQKKFRIIRLNPQQLLTNQFAE